RRWGLGWGEGGLVDRLRSTIERIEFGRYARGFARVFLQKKTHAEIGTADAAASIDARAQKKAEVPRFRRTGETRHIHERRRTRMFASPQCDKPFGNKGPVEAVQRHNVRDRAKRHQMQKRQEIRFAARA